MTGNTKVWRAPLAGLASLAMLATMGVAAGTANASTWADPAAGTKATQVKVNGTGVQRGWSYADVISDGTVSIDGALTTASVSGSLLANDAKTSTFAGYTVNGESAALTDVAKDGAVVKAPRDLYDKNNGVLLHYTANTGTKTVDLGYVWASAEYASTNHDTLNVTVTPGQLPYDAADGTALNLASVDTPDQTGVDLSKGGSFKVKAARGSTVELTVAASDAYQLTFDDLTGTVIYPGSIADKEATRKLVVDVPQGGTFDPQPLIDNAVVQSPSKQAIKRFINTVAATPASEALTSSTKIDGNKPWFPDLVNAYTVTYKDGDTTLKTVEVYEGGKPAAYTPTREDGSYFAGWKTATGATVKPENVPVNKDGIVYYASWVNGGNHSVTYKFNDGTTADQKVTVKASQKVARPENPKRDGFIFAGWYVDANNDGLLNAGENEFTGFGAPISQDYTLIAKWLQADKATLEAAFDYVDGGDASFNKDKYQSVFTDASFKAYVATYQGVQAKYADAKDLADSKNEEIPADTYNSLLNELVAGWQKLEFAHSGGLNAPTVVHRLAKGNDHFYTQDRAEVLGLTAPLVGGSWTDEGRLFQTAPKDVDQYGHLETFDVVAGDNPTTPANEANQDIVATLNSIAKPILTKVTRLYNTRNGDHVWTVDQNEADYLSAQAEWNNEGDAFYVPTYTGSQAVTRLSKGNRHLLSTDSNEVKVLTADGWGNEGTAFKAY